MILFAGYRWKKLFKSIVDWPHDLDLACVAHLIFSPEHWPGWRHSEEGEKHPFWMSCIPHLCDLHAMVLWGMTQCLLWWLCRPILNICWAKLINLGTMDIIFHKDLLAQAIVAGQRTFSLTKVHFTIHMLPDIFSSKRETMLEQQRSCHCSVSLQT